VVPPRALPWADIEEAVGLGWHGKAVGVRKPLAWTAREGCGLADVGSRWPTRDVAVGLIALATPRSTSSSPPSFPNSVWERNCSSKLRFAAVATELPRQWHSQTEFGNEERERERKWKRERKRRDASDASLTA
jgi:hypothetical protein